MWLFASGFEWQLPITHQGPCKPNELGINYNQFPLRIFLICHAEKIITLANKTILCLYLFNGWKFSMINQNVNAMPLTIFVKSQNICKKSKYCLSLRYVQ